MVNLLVRLHKLARKQDENFVTEAFVHLLLSMKKQDSAAAWALLVPLLGWEGEEAELNLDHLSILTQVHTPYGIPDIVLRGDHLLFYIEVKIESDFEKHQLSRYRSDLADKGKASGVVTRLITLTKYPIDYLAAEERPDHAVRWHEVSDWLSELKTEDPEVKFLTRQFNDFIRERGVTMDAVGWEYIKGSIQVKSMFNMLGEALASQKINIHAQSMAINWFGYYLEKKRLFVGFYFENPTLLTFNTEAELKKGIDPAMCIKGKIDGHWYYEVDLASEDVHFFSRSKESQMIFLENLIKETVPYGLSLVEQ